MLTFGFLNNNFYFNFLSQLLITNHTIAFQPGTSKPCQIATTEKFKEDEDKISKHHGIKSNTIYYP